MATTQTVILASGTTAASSAAQTLDAGVEAKVCAYTTSAQWADGAYLTVKYDTPGDDQFIARLTEDSPGVRLVGPLTFIVSRGVQPTGHALAAIKET